MSARPGQLSAGITPRRRALFGLLDSDGWSWATVKATFWFVVIILLLAYIPDRAYYFTVFSTIDLGINAISPINLCPPENRTLPCPAPPGAAIPWDPSPQQLALPAPRVDGAAIQASVKILYIGGSDGQTASDKVFVSDAFTPGNFSEWKTGPNLPAPRDKPAVAFLGGSVYVVGGSDASGAPTNTTYVLTPDPATGALSNWQTAADTGLPIDLPEARSGAMLVATGDGLVLVGGVGPDGKPTNTVWKATTDSTTAKLGAWQPNAPMVQPNADGTASLPASRADGTAVFSGSYRFVYGGRDASGPTATVLRGEIGSPAAAAGAGPSPSASAAAVPTQVLRWSAGLGASNLPAARTDAAGFTANGGLYLVGGSDGTNPKGELYWAIPDSTGTIPEWKHIGASDLPPAGLSGSAAVAVGSHVYLIGGRTGAGILAGALRASLAPQPPFFQLGLIGATVPALKIEGEVGQQLGYLAAAGAATLNFVVLLIIGWAYAHKDRTRELWIRLRRRRSG
jgi:hypothetical protein